MKRFTCFIMILIISSSFSFAKTKLNVEKIGKDELFYVKYEGEYLYGVKWDDKNGFNFAVFTRDMEFTHMNTNDDELFIGSWQGFIKAYHFAGKNIKNLKLVRIVQDWNQEPCGDPPFGLNICFNKESISVTDVDNNGYGELTFMYYILCASELTPVTTKLMVLEDGKKYAIRGKTGIKEYNMPEVKNIDASFNKAAKKLKEYASKHWDKYINHTEYKNDLVKDYPEKTLLNAEYISKHPWKATINPEDYKYPVPTELVFNEDGTGKYTFSGKKWLDFQWDCEWYPDLVTNFPGKFKFIEGYMEYHVIDKDDKETVILYEK